MKTSPVLACVCAAE